MKWLRAKNSILFILVLITTDVVLGQPAPPKMRRVCRPGTENNLFFFPSGEPCPMENYYVVWGRNGTTGTWEPIDTIHNKTADFYQHIGANPIGTPTNWFYFISYFDSCSMQASFSDTMAVDETPPDTLFLDSVSVDILTNKVQIGWRKNPSPDFYRYLVYFENGGVWAEVTTSIVRDTFLIDNNAVLDPRLRPIKYDITSKDSCDTRAQVFNINPHTTMYLSGSADTCKKEVKLTWTHYIGWSKIAEYQVFKQTNGGDYEQIGSVSGAENTYTTPILLGDVNDFFIRAVKDTTIRVTSSSSLLTLQTRSRKEPENTLLVNISAIDADENAIEATFIIPNNEESQAVTLKFNTEEDRTNFIVYASPIPTLNKNGIVSGNRASPDKNAALHYKLISVGLCNDNYENAGLMPQIVVKAEVNETENIITWNKHFGWDTDVALYRIYRGTDDDFGLRAYELIDSVSFTDTTYSDTNLPDKIGSFGLCYYVEAVQNSGSPTGLKSIAKSFSSCAIGETKVFVPNAFVPYGVNKFFRPEGSYIDYVNSSLEIFDRWGGRIITIKDITNGWDGRTPTGEMCQEGVYFYKLILTSPNGTTKTRNGFVTLLH